MRLRKTVNNVLKLLNELKNNFKDGHTLCVYNKDLETIEINDGKAHYTIAYDNKKSVMVNNNGNMWLATGEIKAMADGFSKIIKSKGDRNE